jgi:hypothetical protein
VIWLRKAARLAMTVRLIAAVVLAAGAAVLSGVSVAHADKVQVRYALDEASRAAMVSIRDLVANNHSLVTHRRMPPATARRMAEKVRRLADGVRDNGTLPQSARKAIEPILDALVSGVEAVVGDNKQIGPIDGIVMMDEALARYAREFDHPGWRAPRQL